MFLVSTPRLLRGCFSKDLIWDVDTYKKEVFLTFDDGPDPRTTPVILELLERYNVQATFFCLGKNAENHPALMEALRRNGHSIGNHTFSHLNGWKTHTHKYIADIEKLHAVLGSSFFRPPYGRIKPSQIRILKKKFRIIMWSVLTGDFDRNIPPEKCFQNSIKFLKPGSIIVFHDSVKAFPNVQKVLPDFIKHCLDSGYSFSAIR